MGAPENLAEKMAGIVRRHGEWLDDIPLPGGLWTRNKPGVPHTRMRRLVQIISDLAGKPLADCTILDLGCLEGIFSIECALHGARVTGIDARKANIEKARFCQQELGLRNLQFQVADVRDLSPNSHGVFDIVLCSGLLYHLDVPDVFQVIQALHAMTLRFVVFDTHISLRPDTAVTHAGKQYHGHVYREHPAGASAEEIEAKRLASYGNPTSFWFTRPSLMNALSHAGFSSVYECFNPPHLNFGQPGIESRDRCTLVAVKGSRVRLETSPAASELHEDWPEDSLDYPTSSSKK